MPHNLLIIHHLTVTAPHLDGEDVLVDDISLEVAPDRVCALVGASGSGKTTTGLAIMRLLDPALKVTQGEICFEGENLLRATAQRMREVRGGGVGMIFQEPLSAFNPVFTLGFQVEEVLRYHTDLRRKDRKKRVLELFDMVGLPDPSRVARSYPHQLSGGMRQRVMIAQAIAAEPRLIIADEPTSSLDVTLQARIMELFRRLKRELSLSFLLITHDFGMVRHLADDILVMRDGGIVERGELATVLADPQHGYTQQLIEASEG